jgi:integrase
VSVYKRGSTWWYKFQFAGKLIRESAKTGSKTLAKEAEKQRRRDLEKGYNNLQEYGRSQRILTFREAAAKYLEDYKPRHAAKSIEFQEYAIKHLNEHFGDLMLIEISDRTLLDFQNARLSVGAAGKTINEETNISLRIMGHAGDELRLKLRRDKRLRVPQTKSIGKALDANEEERLFAEAWKLSTPELATAIVVFLNTALRHSELTGLTWGQVDFFKQMLTVGKSKTDAGTGRTIPMNSDLVRALAGYKSWYEANVAKAVPEHYVFPTWQRGKYDPSKPRVTFQQSWSKIRKKAGVRARIHDLRHSLITKLAESGAGDETIMAIAGHVTRDMLTHYAHIRTEAKRRALETITAKPAGRTADPAEAPAADTPTIQ